MFIVTDCPDGNDVRVLWDYNGGKIGRYEYDTKPAPADFRMDTQPWDESVSLFRVQGAYETYVKIQKREMSLMAAMAAKIYKWEGDMIKARAVMPYMVAAADLQATIECDY